MPLVRTQTDRRARSRNALLHSAARGPSTYRYANLVLERVITEAGHTPGARYIPVRRLAGPGAGCHELDR